MEHIMKKTILTCVLISTGSLSSTLQAETYNQEANAAGAYIGASYGYLRVDGDEDFDDDKDAYQLFAGYSFNQYITFEGSYLNFGDYGNSLANAETDGYTLGLKLSLPVINNIDIYARGGQLWYETDYSVLGIDGNKDDTGLFAGIGASYHLNEDWSVKVDYTLYDNDLDVDSASDDLDNAEFSTDMKHAAIGVEYKF
jgi:opacity protein-like surface antigen